MALLGSCHGDSGLDMLGPSFSGSAPPQCLYGQPGGFHSGACSCNTPIAIYVPTNFQPAAILAATRWNLMFGHSADGNTASAWAPEIPRLHVVSDSSGADVIMKVNGSTNASGEFCGSYDHTTHRITLDHGMAPASPCFTNSADATSTLVHEFGHVLGLNTNLENGPPGTDCTMRLTDLPDENQFGINGTPCQHEAEYILIAYGYGFGGNAARDPDQDWWDDPILTDLVVSPSVDTLIVGSSVDYTVQSLKYGGTTQPVGSVRFAWSSDDPLIADVATDVPSITRQVTASGLGSTIVRAAPETGIPSDHIVSSKLWILGKPIPITVLPNTAPFRITDITGPVPPIEVPGGVTFHAIIQNPPPGTVYYRWELEASNNAFPAVDVETTSASRWLDVPSGSYQVTVTVTPRVGTTTAYHRTETWPVCTGGGGGGGGGDLLIEPMPGGGPTPNAKTGC